MRRFDRDFRDLHGYAPEIQIEVRRTGFVPPRRGVAHPGLRLMFGGVGLLFVIVLGALLVAQAWVFAVFAWASVT